MKLKILLACMIFVGQVYSQCPKYHQAMKAGKVLLEKKAFEKALIEFQAAQIAARECQIVKNEPTIMLQAAFDRIQSQRDIAIEAEKKALESTQIAILEKQKAELARLQADSAYVKAEELKEMAIKQEEEALLLNKKLSRTIKRNTALVGGVYFYANNYGLGYNVQTQRFYYFDTLGKAHFQDKNLTFYEAEQFNNSGYARIREQETTRRYSYFDTLGLFYPIAQNVNQINEKTVFVELSDENLKKIPNRLWKKRFLKSSSNQRTSLIKSIDLSRNNIYKIPKKVKYLNGVEVLNLSENQINHFPKSLTQLEKITILNLSNETSYLYFGNRISRLPKGINHLKKLHQLNLNYHDLSKLPNSFSKLEKLEELSLRRNNFRRFPMEVLDLKNLKRLDLSGNKIKKLPVDFSRMKSLEILNLSGNPIDEKEITQLKKTLPNLQIIQVDSTLKKRDHLLSIGIVGLSNKLIGNIVDSTENDSRDLGVRISVNYTREQYGVNLNYSNFLETNGFELNIFRNFINLPIKTSLGIGNIYSPFYYKGIEFIDKNNDEKKTYIKILSTLYFTTSIEYLIKKRRRNNTMRYSTLLFSFDFSPKATAQRKVKLSDVTITNDEINLSISRFSIGYAYYFGKTLNFKKPKF